MGIALVTDGLENPCVDFARYFAAAGLVGHFGSRTDITFYSPELFFSRGFSCDDVFLSGDPFRGDLPWESLLEQRRRVRTLSLNLTSYTKLPCPSLLRHCLESEGRIKAANGRTVRLVEGELGPGRAEWTGNTACLLQSRRFFDRPSGAVLCVDDRRDIPWIKILKSLRRRIPTLTVGNTCSAVQRNARPGLHTFFSPTAPEFHTRALVNAKFVVSGTVEPLLVAIANHVPACWLGHEKQDEAEALRYGIPTLRISGSDDPDAYYFKILTLLAFPIKKALPVRKPAEPSLTVAVVASRNFLLPLIGLIENLNQVCRAPLEYHLLAIDPDVRNFFRDRYPTLRLFFYSLDDLWESATLDRNKKWSVAQWAYASKAKLLEKILAVTRRTVFFLDTDLYFFESPESLVNAFAEGNTLLFPHWNDSFSATRKFGIFNSGFVGVRPGAERFLKWWSTLCSENCEDDPEDGFYYEQAYLDLAPVLFPETVVHQWGDHNVGHWNLHTLGVSEIGGTFWIDGGLTIKSFHAAAPDLFGLFKFKAAWDQLLTFFALPECRYTANVIEMTLAQQRSVWPELDIFLKARHTLFKRMKCPGEKLFLIFFLPLMSTLGMASLRIGAQIYRWNRRGFRWLRRGRSPGAPAAPTIWARLNRESRRPPLNNAHASPCEITTPVFDS
jgi:hypothetical protein